MADVNFDCPHCGQNLEGPESMVGTCITCPACHKALTVPKHETAGQAAPSRHVPKNRSATKKDQANEPPARSFKTKTRVVVALSVVGVVCVLSMVIFFLPRKNDGWPRYFDTNNALFVESTNDTASVLVAKYWDADFLDRAQFTLFSKQRSARGDFQEHYGPSVAEGRINAWSEGFAVNVSTSRPITWVDGVDGTIWRAVEVNNGISTNTERTIYAVNMDGDTPLLLWETIYSSLNLYDRNESKSAFDLTRPALGELIYLSYLDICEEELPDIPLLRDQISSQFIESFPERLRDKYAVLWGTFHSLTDSYLDNLPGITISGNGLISRINVTEKEKHLGFAMQLNARIGNEIDRELFFKCFTYKTPGTFDAWKTVSEDTFLVVLGRFITLDRMGGDLGFYASRIETYDLGTGKWKALTE